MCKLAAVLCFLVWLSTGAWAEARGEGMIGCFEYFRTDSGNISFVMAKGQEMGRWPCGDEECRARRDLTCAANALMQRLTPNTMAYPTRADADRHWFGFGRVIWSLGRTHPARIPRYCRLLAEVARTVTGDETKDGRTARNVVELGILLDRPGNGCLKGVLGALPDVATVRADRRNWDSMCLPDVRRCQRSLDGEYLR